MDALRHAVADNLQAGLPVLALVCVAWFAASCFSGLNAWAIRRSADRLRERAECEEIMLAFRSIQSEADQRGI